MMTVRQLIATLTDFDAEDEVLIFCSDGEAPIGDVRDEGHGVVIYTETVQEV
jgi:hypothetical protein